jgi:hypothetical protein
MSFLPSTPPGYGDPPNVRVVCHYMDNQALPHSRRLRFSGYRPNKTRVCHHRMGMNETWVPGTAPGRESLMSKVIFVTGAGRGLGTDIAREALDAGHQVVATGRRPEDVEKSLHGPQDNLLVTKLDGTSPEDAQAAAQAAVDRFGRIDGLINNAGNFIAGYFEEISPA